ncbi:PPC domain-containing DNA-binding protein [Saccharopolyspora griseoalba]|uniref:PPC domain-containing DNA-binding protein n=1 Tax=Saccharopolyspora griseoalba TaxID=1431848 RepID=A0ABW2LNF7_9PSEU
MRSKQLVTGAPATYVAVLDSGDEVLDELSQFVRARGIGTGSVSAIGGLSRATLAYFDPETAEYQDIPVEEQVEVLSLTGVISSGRDEPELHLHAVLGRRDGSTRGGHLKAGRVHPTLEVSITESPPHVVRRYDESTGLALIDLDAWETGRSS